MIDTVGRNNAEINWEYAVIERLDEHDLSTRLIPFRLVNAIDNRASVDNQLLRAGDVVTIFSRADLDLPMEKHASFVRVGGEVNAPGVYRVNPGQTLRDVVEAAGGSPSTPICMPLSLPAFPPVMRKRRNCGRHRADAKRTLCPLCERYTHHRSNRGGQQAQLTFQQTALARLSSIKPTGRVVLEMKSDAATVADIPDFSLEDGDTFYVPPRLSTVRSPDPFTTQCFPPSTGEKIGRLPE